MQVADSMREIFDRLDALEKLVKGENTTIERRAPSYTVTYNRDADYLEIVSLEDWAEETHRDGEAYCDYLRNKVYQLRDLGAICGEIDRQTEVDLLTGRLYLGTDDGDVTFYMWAGYDYDHL